jgi:hypothetical protein
MVANPDSITVSSKREDAPSIRIRIQPRPLPDDFSSRLAKIYALAVQRLEEYEAAQQREGAGGEHGDDAVKP